MYRGAAASLLGLAQYASGDLDAAQQTLSASFAAMDPIDAITGAFVLALVVNAAVSAITAPKRP